MIFQAQHTGLQEPTTPRTLAATSCSRHARLAERPCYAGTPRSSTDMWTDRISAEDASRHWHDRVRRAPIAAALRRPRSPPGPGLLGDLCLRLQRGCGVPGQGVRGDRGTADVLAEDGWRVSVRGRCGPRPEARPRSDRRPPAGARGPSRVGPWSYRSAFEFGASLGAGMKSSARGFLEGAALSCLPGAAREMAAGHCPSAREGSS
jgi:hypothetical protein